METRAFDEQRSTGEAPPEYEGGGANPPVHKEGGTNLPVHKEGGTNLPVHEGNGAMSPEYKGGEADPSVDNGSPDNISVYSGSLDSTSVYSGSLDNTFVYGGSPDNTSVYNRSLDNPSAYEGRGVDPPAVDGGSTPPPAAEAAGMAPPGQEETLAYPSAYLDRPASTVLMLVKLIDALVRAGSIAVSFCFAMSIVAALNAVARSGISSAAVVLEWLKEAGVPMESIQEISEIISSGKTFSISGGPIILAFAIFLPFLLISVLEAIAAVRLRFGSGGARTIRVLHKLLFVFGIVKLVLAIGLVIILAGSSKQVSDPEMGTAIMIIAIAAGVLFVALHIPGLFYHSYIARAMKEIRYELETEERARIKPTRLGALCVFYIVLEGIGILGSIIASIVMWAALSGLSKQVPFIPSIGYNPIYPLMMAVFHMWMVLRYICVMRCYRNFLEAEGEDAKQYEGRSPVIPAMLTVLVIFLFIIPTVLLCVKVRGISTSVSEKAENFIRNAEETIIEAGNTAKSTVSAVSKAASEAGSESSPDAAAAAQLEMLQQVLEILDVLGTEP